MEVGTCCVAHIRLKPDPAADIISFTQEDKILLAHGKSYEQLLESERSPELL